jgi:hypothetical protein
MPFGPMHAVTRLERVEQQLRSFDQLHASELAAVAAELEAAGAPDLAARLRTFAQLHGDEARIVLEELADIREGLATEAGMDDRPPANPPTSVDPAAASPKRARWLAEEARRAAAEPVSRRAFLTGAKGDHD